MSANAFLCFNVSNFSGMTFNMLCTIAYIIVLPLFREEIYVLVYEFNFYLKFEWTCTKLQIIDTVRKHILTGGPKRLPFTVPPLMFSSLKVWLTILISLLLLFYPVLPFLLIA